MTEKSLVRNYHLGTLEGVKMIAMSFPKRLTHRDWAKNKPTMHHSILPKWKSLYSIEHLTFLVFRNQHHPDVTDFRAFVFIILIIP